MYDINNPDVNKALRLKRQVATTIESFVDASPVLGSDLSLVSPESLKQFESQAVPVAKQASQQAEQALDQIVRLRQPLIEEAKQTLADRQKSPTIAHRTLVGNPPAPKTSALPEDESGCV